MSMRFKFPKIQNFAALISGSKVSLAVFHCYFTPINFPKLLIKPLIHRIAAVVEVADVVIGFGVVEVEFQARSVSERIGAGLNCKLSPGSLPGFRAVPVIIGMQIPLSRERKRVYNW